MIFYLDCQKVILARVLFNTFLCDMFSTLKAVCFTGYADNNAAFAIADNIKDAARSLEEVGKNLINMKLNPDKCHLLLNTNKQIILKIDSSHIKIPSARNSYI